MAGTCPLTCVEAWLDNRKAELSPTTGALWESLWRLHASPELGDVQLAAIDAHRVKAFVGALRTKGCGAATIRNALKMLGTAMSAADQNPFATFIRRQRKKQAGGARAIASATPTAKGPVIGSEAAARRFVAAARSDRFFALWVLLAGTGLRLGEALGLEWRSVDLRRGTVEITQTLVEVNGSRFVSPRPKTEQSERVIAIGPTIVVALKEHRSSGATSARFVFTTDAGEHPSRANLRKRHFIPVRDAAKLGEVPIKNLRHSHASLLDAAGVAIATVSKRLGHAHPAMTLRVYRKRVAGEDPAAADTWEQIIRGGKNRQRRK